MIDRVTPTKRPTGLKRAGTQSWKELLFVHWELPAKSIRPLLPEGLELDTYEGKAFVGAVPFAMEKVQPSWLPFGMDFLETNLRTYVHVGGEPGVWFFSLEAASWLAVKAARIGWNLPYHFATMESTKEGNEVRYKTTRKDPSRAHFEAHYTIGEKLAPATPESLEFFLLERYLLFSEKGGRLYRGQVHHVPYPAHLAEVHALSESLFAAASLPATSGPPSLAHYSPGVDVDVYALEPI